MFDHVAVHVDNPQGPIRSRSDHHGATPAVFAGEKVRLFFGGIATESEADAIVGDQVVLDEVVERFAGKGVLLGTAAAYFVLPRGEPPRRGQPVGPGFLLELREPPSLPDRAGDRDRRRDGDREELEERLLRRERSRARRGRPGAEGS